MEIILSKQCLSLSGCLGRGYGYYLRRTKTGRFFSQRSKHSVPPDGHWRFIALCAELAQNHLHIADIKVGWLELESALYEAHHFIAKQQVRKDFANWGKLNYDACDILNLKTKFGL